MLTACFSTVQLFRLCIMRISEEIHQLFKRKVPADGIPNERAYHRQPFPIEAPEEGSDFRNVTTGNRAFLAHFQNLMPTTDPVQSLQSLENRLNQRIEKLERREG